MTRRGLQDDDDDGQSDDSRATSLELRSPFAPPQPDPNKPDNATVRVTSGYRLAPTVTGFRIVGGPKPLEVTQGIAQLGADAANDLRLDDSTVSRFHCEVRIEDGRALVRDLNSTNGTFVDDVRVKEGFLRDGSVLKLGRFELKFELLDRICFLDVSEAPRFGELVGRSAAMGLAFRVLEKAARSDSTIIVEGETGTGKTRAAQALHELSARAQNPFLVVDCGAIPPSLLEAELFGHEKGAFTGAANRRIGVFEEAKGGTVLLDEIGELPLELQPRLLRVLEDRQIRRIGQNQWTKVDCRILAATHRDLRNDVNAGRFRSDLYFRLAVARVKLPSLREHPDDIPEVAQELLTRLGATPQANPALFAQSFFDRLKAHRWPGNVRELRNYLERCLLFEEPVPLSESSTRLPPAQSAAGDSVAAPVLGGRFTDARQKAIDAFEKAYLEHLLDRHQGKVAKAAVEAEVDRVYLYRLMRKHGISTAK